MARIGTIAYTCRANWFRAISLKSINPMESTMKLATRKYPAYRRTRRAEIAFVDLIVLIISTSFALGVLTTLFVAQFVMG